MLGLLKKYADLMIVVIVVLALFFYDVTIELSNEVIHFIVERLVELFEWVELFLEHFIEHVFHTSHHGAQIGTFYVLFAFCCYVVYRLWHSLPALYERTKQRASDAWIQRRTELELYWLSLTLTYKVILICTALLVGYIASFFVM
ncbi:MAG: hypothetical protein ACU836_03650 [Gammaproteobacteria bacterium]